MPIYYGKNLENLTRSELIIWAAGFFEGEGSIMLDHKVSNRYKGVKFYRKLRLSVSQKYKEPLVYFYSLYGGSLIQDKQGMWDWVIADSNAEFCLKELMPFLVNKKREAEIALKMRDRLRNIEGYGKGKYFSEQDISDINVFRFTLDSWRHNMEKV